LYSAETGGAQYFIETIQNAEKLEQLPNDYNSLLELARIKFAFHIYQSLHTYFQKKESLFSRFFCIDLRY
jgi:hypothetical protein